MQFTKKTYINNNSLFLASELWKCTSMYLCDILT